MTISTKQKAISNLAPGAIFAILSDETIDWQSPEITIPSDEDIQNEISRLEQLEPLVLLRRMRNSKLTQCDWTQFPDVPESTRLAWQPYRQALRDITNTYSNLQDVVWPTKPE